MAITLPEIAPESRSDILRIFVGYDPRQPVSTSVAMQSICRRASVPVAVTPLMIQTLPLTRVGLTPFTYSRFLVPWLCGYAGMAMFVDADVLVLGDVAELFALAQENRGAAVSVVPNKKRFEWASMMVFNCANYHNRRLTPEAVNDDAQMSTDTLIGVKWTDAVGPLPSEWNHLVGYDEPRADAKLVHFTQGVPAWPETKGCEYSDQWWDEVRVLTGARPWAELMATSVHAATLPDGRVVPKLRAAELTAA